MLNIFALFERDVLEKPQCCHRRFPSCLEAAEPVFLCDEIATIAGRFIVALTNFEYSAVTLYPYKKLRTVQNNFSYDTISPTFGEPNSF